jgi:hypothetical protein
MVHLREDTGKGEPNGFGITAGQWQEIRKSPVVDDAFLADQWSLTVTGADLPEDVQADYLSSNAFDYFGVPAYLGRGLHPSDAVDGQDPQPVAVLGYKFWQRHYGSDKSVVGKTIQLVHKNYTVVGVAAKRFTWDDAEEDHAGRGAGLLCRSSPQTRRDKSSRAVGARSADSSIRERHAEALSSGRLPPGAEGIQR